MHATRRSQHDTIRNRKSLAPDIDPRWAEEFILTARLEEIPGDVIGDALGEVNDHCRSANESALEAFGPARDYVEQIAADVEKVKSPSILILLGPAFLQIVGVVLCLQGVYGLASGTSHSLDWATVAVLGIVGVLLLCAVFCSNVVVNPSRTDSQLDCAVYWNCCGDTRNHP